MPADRSRRVGRREGPASEPPRRGGKSAGAKLRPLPGAIAGLPPSGLPAGRYGENAVLRPGSFGLRPQDDRHFVILRSVTTKNLVCRRMYSGRMPIRATRSDLLDEWASRSAQDGTVFCHSEPAGRRIPDVGDCVPAECRSTDGILACPGGGKTVTAAGGGRKEQFCGGGTELKEALWGDAQRRFRRVGKSLTLRMTAHLSF